MGTYNKMYEYGMIKTEKFSKETIEQDEKNVEAMMEFAQKNAKDFAGTPEGADLHKRIKKRIAAIQLKKDSLREK